MEARQKQLINEIKKSFEEILEGKSYLGVNIPALEDYRITLLELTTEYPNKATFEFGLQLMHHIYNAKIEKKFGWLNDVEKYTYLSFNITDLNEDE